MLIQAAYGQGSLYYKSINGLSLQEVHTSGTNGFLGLGFNGLFQIDTSGNIGNGAGIFDTLIESVGIDDFARTPDSSLVIIGDIGSFEYSNIFAARFNSKDSLIYSKVLVDTGSSFEFDLGVKIIQTNDGGTILLGNYDDGSDEFLTSKIVAIKLDSIGGFVWSELYSQLSYGNVVTDGIELPDGNLFFLANGQNGPNSSIFNGIINQSGQLISFNYIYYPSGQDNYFLPQKIFALTDSDIFCYGSGALWCFTSSGSIKWCKCYSVKGSGSISGAIRNASGDFFATGACNVYHTDSTGNRVSIQNIFLSYLDSTASPVWTKVYGTCTGESNIGMAKNDGNILVWGNLATQDSGVILQTDSAGSAPCYFQMDTLSIDSTPFFETSNDLINVQVHPGKVMQDFSGLYWQSITMNTGDFCDHSSLCPIYWGIQTLDPPVNLEVFPNPATTYLEIELQNPLSGLWQISIYDLTGQVLSRQAMNAFDKNEINIATLSPGMYFIKIQDGQKQLSAKFVKQ